MLAAPGVSDVDTSKQTLGRLVDEKPLVVKGNRPVLREVMLTVLAVLDQNCLTLNCIIVCLLGLIKLLRLSSFGSASLASFGLGTSGCLVALAVISLLDGCSL